MAMAEAVKIAQVNLEVKSIAGIAEAAFTPGVIDIYDLANINLEQIPMEK